MPYILLLALMFPGLNAVDDSPEKPGPVLVNAGFESDTPLDGWKIVTYGAPATVERDEQDVREGKRALRVSATEPSDTALGQEIDLTPGRWFRFSGWVRTRGLDPLGSPVSGTYQIQHPEGKGIIASGASQRGDTDWTRIEIVFQAPSEGRVRIAPFFVGYGKGKGTVWFDGLALEPFDPSSAPIIVTRDRLRSATISPLQYGQFIEYLCDLVPSMWADKLCDGSFEGLSPYKFFYLKETDSRERAWYPSGATNRATFGIDRTTKVDGEASYRIAAEEAVPCTVGMSQDGLAVTKGVGCNLTCAMMRRGVSGPVRVRLHHEGTVLASCELNPTDDWSTLQARLVPSQTETNTTLSFEFRGPGTLWIDCARLMPDDAIGGWRRDVVEAVRAMKPGVIRFGGSTLDDPNLGAFEWKETVGPVNSRRPFRAWGGNQPTGAGLEEFVQFCRQVGAEPLICVRIREKTPGDAAEQVEYFNGDVNTPMGAMRAKNGHSEPYHVRYWQVGNEQGGPDYEARLPEFCKAMKKADPSIELLASFPTEGVVKGSGAWIDFVAPHHYDCTNVAGAKADFDSIRQMLERLAPGRSIRVAVTEWNTTAGDIGPRRARLWTLENALACARYHNLMHRECDLVTIANRSNLTNSFCSGCIQTDNHRLFGTPTYHMQRLYATLAGDIPLRVESAIPVSLAPDLSATFSEKDRILTLLAVNDGVEAITRPLDLSAFGPGGREVEVWTLADSREAGEVDVRNSFAEPERIAPRRSRIAVDSPRFVYRFPPLSLTVLRWQVRDAEH